VFPRVFEIESLTSITHRRGRFMIIGNEGTMLVISFTLRDYETIAL